VPTVNIVLLSSPVKRAIAGMTYLIQLQIWRLEIWMAKWCTTNICLSCLSFAFTIKLCNNSIFINIKAYCVVRYLFRKWLENLLILVQSHWTDRLYSRQRLHLRRMIKSFHNKEFQISLVFDQQGQIHFVRTDTEILHYWNWASTRFVISRSIGRCGFQNQIYGYAI
jgi:hypothetical protein